MAAESSAFAPVVVPKYFNSSESCQVVVIYPDALSGSATDEVILVFPGLSLGSAPIRVIPERVGNRALVFTTPAYKTSFSSHKMIDVLPVLHDQQKGETVELKPFSLAVKNPMKSIIELCLNLSTNEAVLPVLVTLMLHCKGDPEKSNFQDPQFDRILSTLVGSRPPKSGVSIKDILLPKERASLKKLDLAALCKEYQLTSTEEQLNALKLGKKSSRPRPVAEKTKLKGATRFYEYLIPLSDKCLSSSTPDFTTSLIAESLSNNQESTESLKEKAEALDHRVQASDSQHLSLKKTAELGASPLLHVSEGLSLSAHADLDKAGLSKHFRREHKPLPPPLVKAAAKEPMFPLAKRNLMTQESEPGREGLGDNVYANVATGVRGSPSVPHLHSTYYSDETGPQNIREMPSVVPDVKPRPRRPRTKKPISDSPDCPQGTGTSVEFVGDHMYEDIDSIQPRTGDFILPPRNILRPGQPVKVPPKTSPRPLGQRRIVAPDEALHAELRQRMHREQVPETHYFEADI